MPISAPPCLPPSSWTAGDGSDGSPLPCWESSVRSDSDGTEEAKRLPVGVSDFKDMMTGDYYYVDKTLFIKEVIDKGDKILLIPRPRRFGKTLNLSMLKYFYDCCPDSWFSDSQPPEKNEEKQGNSSKQLFQSLAILDADQKYLDKLGRYPVIFLSFRSIKDRDWESCINKIKQLIRYEYRKHKYLLDSPALDEEFEKEYFKKILNLTALQSDYENSLENLLIFLNRFYDERVVILIDEYDGPVHAGFNNGYYEQVIGFMRNFLCGGLKDTGQYLEKGVITGIMRIAKESIFSGLNNLGVYTLMAVEF